MRSSLARFSLTAALITITAMGWAQSGVSSSSAVYKETDKRINEATHTNNDGKKVGALMFAYEGNFGQFMVMLSDSLGKPVTVLESGTTKEVEFQRFTKPNWSDKKITFVLRVTSNGNKHLIFVTCKDNKRNDLLAVDSETLPKIKTFLLSLLDKKD